VPASKSRHAGAGPDVAVSRYLLYLNMGDFQSAYEALTTTSQKKCSYQDFEKKVKSTLYDVKGVTSNDKDDSKSEVEAKVLARVRGGTEKEMMTCKFMVIKENGKWKIDLYHE
jgi:hypothetical protein